MLTILTRISSDIRNYVGASELFLLSMFLRVQGENKVYFFGDFTGNMKQTICTHPTPRLLQRSWISNETKSWAGGNSHLVSNSIGDRGERFSLGFLLSGRGRSDFASASSCGSTDQSSLWAGSEGKCHSQVPRTKILAQVTKGRYSEGSNDQGVTVTPIKLVKSLRFQLQ